MRIIKSAAGVFLCLLIYILRGKTGTPFYSALAVLWCIQSRVDDTRKNALQRVIGTFIGAIYGLIYILVKKYLYDLGYGLFHYLVISLMIVPIIYSSVILNKKNASYFSCVVYLSIVVNHLADENPIIFVANRSLDTLIGILIGMLVNLFPLHGKGNSDTLFIADLDYELRCTHEKLTPYSRITLKKMIEDGMLFTVMTMRTPASYLEVFSDICPSLPIIAMDGALLYNVSENTYPKAYVISSDHSDMIEKIICFEGFQTFTTVIRDDVLLIYHGELVNEAERQIYGMMRRSPYRNYLNMKRPAGCPVVYFMVIDITKKILSLKEKIIHSSAGEHLKILCYESDDYAGYSYLKIYNQNASVDNMIDYLKNNCGAGSVVTVSDEKSRYHVDITERDSDHIIKKLYHMYYSSARRE